MRRWEGEGNGLGKTNCVKERISFDEQRRCDDQRSLGIQLHPPETLVSSVAHFMVSSASVDTLCCLQQATDLL